MLATLTCASWLTLLLGAPQSAAEKLSPGWGLWQQGQEAMRQGDTGKAVDLFEQSLASDARLSRNYLSLAACYLDRGEEARACLYLMLYVAAHPEHRVVRFQFIDLLLRLKRTGEARGELEDLIGEMQAETKPDDEQLVQCHSRLMQLAERLEDAYEEHLHRGIGLFLLSRQRPILGDDDDMPCAQGLLCKSAAELTLAVREKPDEARPYLYLHQVWTKLGQSHPARRNLRAAEDAAPFSYLTSTEQFLLQGATRRNDTPRR